MAVFLKCFGLFTWFGKMFRWMFRESDPSPQESSPTAPVPGSVDTAETAVQERETSNSDSKGLDGANETDVGPSSEVASRISHSSRTSHTTLSSELCQRLHHARNEYPPGRHRYYIPESSKEDILTRVVIARELQAAYPQIGKTFADESADKVFNSAKNLFAILAYMKRSDEILALINKGVSDADLPFERFQGEITKFPLWREVGGAKDEVLQHWQSEDREEFSREQWCMLARVFEEKEHYVLHSNEALPFVAATNPGQEGEESLSGHAAGYSEVFTTRIHNSHHKFSSYWTPEDPHPKVAIKRLFTKKRDDFENERSILVTLGNKTRPHPHLVKLLASYECDGVFFLMFPCADCNLRKYWEDRPTPTFNKETVSWSLDQMQGIANALHTVHIFKVTHPHPAAKATLALPVAPGEEIYGRHGDIKPENIIWYERIPGHDNGGKGFLQITDFGLGRFHGRESRTEHYPYDIPGSMTYEPPDCILRRPVRRAYDLWSLGCLYLEFATWLLKGNEAIEDFSERRGLPSKFDRRFNDDHFFTLGRDDSNQSDVATVREAVIKWVEILHADENCSRFIHDLLELVMRDLLVIEATDRVEASSLCNSFNKFKTRSEEDEGYLYAPHPHQQSS